MTHTRGDSAADVTDPVRSGPAVFRRAGLPVGVLDALRFPATGRTVDEILAMRSAVTALGRSAADALYPVIGALPSRASLRPRLVGLRRALHQGRRPTAGEWSADVADRLPAEAARDIRRWSAGLEELRSAEASLEQVLDDEVRERRAHLLKAAADPAFRLGLDVASPALATELDKWLDDPARSPRTRTVLTLARYLARAAAKTSPLSTFLTSGPVEWVADGPALAVHDRQALGVHELAESSLREDIAELVASRPGVRDDVVLRLNPTADRDGGAIGYVRPAPSQALCSIPARPAVLDVVGLLRTRTAGLTRRALRHHLCDGDSGSAARVDAFIDHLVGAGLLVRVIPVARFETLLDDCAAWLADRRSADPGDRALTDDLRALDRTLATPLAPDQVAPYRDHRRRVVDLVRGLATHAGDADPLRPHLAGRSAAGLRDSVVTREPLASCSAFAWEPVLDDLDVLRRWLAPFAPWLPARLALTELLGDAVAARGTMPLLRFYREVHRARTATGDVHRELDAWLTSPAAMWARDSALESVRRLADVCGTATAALAPYPVQGPAPAPDDASAWPTPVAVDPERLRAAAAEYPAWIPPVRSLEAAVQIVPGDGPEPAVAVNTIMPGFGAVRARIDHLTAPRHHVAPPRLPDVPDGPIYAGFGDRFGLSLNDHRQVLPYTLADAPARAPGGGDATLPIDDLLVRVEEETGLLSLLSRRHRRPVRVVHTGMVVSLWLHPFSHLLSILSGEVLPPSPVPPVAAAAPSDLRSDRPRLTTGRLTLARGARRYPVAEVPVIRPGERPGQYLVRLGTWRREERIPRRCFFTLWRTSAADPRWAPTKWRKPMYLDFESWFLVQGLVSTLQRPDAGAVAFTESLPDPLAPVFEPDRHVGELTIDVSRG